MRLRFFLIPALLAFLAFPVPAQDAFGGIFDDGESGDGNSTEQTENTPQADAGPLFSVTGSVGSLTDWYLSDAAGDQKALFQVPVDLSVKFSSDIAEALLRLHMASAADFSSLSHAEVIDEAKLRIFTRYVQFDLGLMKMEWGKGDGFHAIDPLNPLDQSSGLQNDLNSMKKAELMAVASIFPSLNTKIELVYKPFFHPYITAESGRWMVKDLSVLPNLQPDPDTETSEYSQAAARFTFTAGPADLGVLYYYGFLPEPGYRITTEFLGGDPYNPANYYTSSQQVFTRAQLFGLEGAAAAGIFTFRAELGFWLSEDAEGDIPYLYNNRLTWLGGFDFMIPKTQIFVSIQEAGRYVVHMDDSDPTDVDLGMSTDGRPHSNTLIAAVESSFLKDKLKIRLSGLWEIESDSYVIMPSVFYYPADDLEIELSARFIDGWNSGSNPYYAWRNNDTISLGVTYIF